MEASSEKLKPALLKIKEHGFLKYLLTAPNDIKVLKSRNKDLLRSKNELIHLLKAFTTSKTKMNTLWVSTLELNVACLQDVIKKIDIQIEHNKQHLAAFKKSFSNIKEEPRIKLLYEKYLNSRSDSNLNELIFDLYEELGTVSEVETFFQNFPKLRPHGIPASVNFDSLKMRIHRHKRTLRVRNNLK